MYYFLIWFVPLEAKDFYLIVNVLDVVMCLFSEGWLLNFMYGGLVPWNYNTHRTVNFILAASAIIALIVYFTQNTYRHVIHKIYMLVRLFVTGIVFIFLVLILIDIMGNGRASTDRVIGLIGVGCFNFLNLYWSIQLLKICN